MDTLAQLIRSLAELPLIGTTYLAKIDCGDRNHIYAGLTKDQETLTAQVSSGLIRSVWAAEFTNKEG